MVDGKAAFVSPEWLNKFFFYFLMILPCLPSPSLCPIHSFGSYHVS